MTPIQCVVNAIGDALTEADMKAGWGWITDDERNAIARAAILAIIEPSDAMRRAGVNAWLPSDSSPTVVWRAMIDALLNEQVDSGEK